MHFWVYIHPLYICLSFIMQSYINMCTPVLSVYARIASTFYSRVCIIDVYSHLNAHFPSYKHHLHTSHIHVCVLTPYCVGITLRTLGMYICFIILCMYGKLSLYTYVYTLSMWCGAYIFHTHVYIDPHSAVR